MHKWLKKTGFSPPRRDVGAVVQRSRRAGADVEHGYSFVSFPYVCPEPVLVM